MTKASLQINDKRKQTASWKRGIEPGRDLIFERIVSKRTTELSIVPNVRTRRRNTLYARETGVYQDVFTGLSEIDRAAIRGGRLDAIE